MIQIVEYEQIEKDKQLAPLKARFAPEMSFNLELEKEVRTIIESVRTRGDEAVLEYTCRFDDVTLDSLAPVSPEKLSELHSQVDDNFLGALREAIENVRKFHLLQYQENIEIENNYGVKLGLRYTPIEKVGLYIPGGIVAYSSSVYMNAIPAQIAGVERIVAVTPPGHFEETPEVAAALVEMGLNEVYTIGGAQAVAALAYGTESIPRVDKIVGPGNMYVAEAKRQVFGPVDIDIIAGPSEIVVIADDTAEPSYVAADLLSQAEHGSEKEMVLLLTTSREIALKVQIELEHQLKGLSHSEHAIKVLNANNNALVIVRNLDEVVKAVNRIAPEHLELMVKEPRTLCDKIKNAGAIFLGAYSPEPISDYYAGPNHVLPTSGTARYASPLGVYDFQKCTSIVEYTKEALEKCADRVDILARSEGFEAHARAVNIRIK